MKIGHLLQDIPDDLPDEMVESLVNAENIRIERIVSKGHCSAAGFWYDQPKNEFVLLVKGEARLRFEEDDEVIHLVAGVHINIPAHKKHRVEWTKENEETVWLAVFY